MLRPLIPRSRAIWLLLTLMLAGAALIVRWDIAQRRAVLQVEARTVHRLLSQATARIDAVLATLALTARADEKALAMVDAAARLPEVYPQLLQAWRRDEGAGPWPDASRHEVLRAAQERSRAGPAAQRHAVLATADGAAAQYTVVLAATPASFALLIDARRLVSEDEWPWPVDAPVLTTLRWADERIVLRQATATALRPSGLTDGFEFTKPLASASQPFELDVQRFTGPAEWPWWPLALWLALCAALAAATQRWKAAQAAQRDAAERMRLAQASRLTTLGELAAGIAHELNQPLTAVLTSTQTALRLLRERSGSLDGSFSSEAASLALRAATEPALEAAPGRTSDPNSMATHASSHNHSQPDDEADDDIQTAQQALVLALAQARRACDVIGRLRRLVQPGAVAAAAVPTDLAARARRLVQLMAGELQDGGVTVTVQGVAPPALADPVAVEQILQNLLMNAMQSMRAARAATAAQAHGTPSTNELAQRAHITITVAEAAGRVHCTVRDTGPGVAPSALPHLFEPFFTTRPGGLGLGLPLCQTLAMAMDGQISLRENSAAGAAFELELPAAAVAAGNGPAA